MANGTCTITEYLSGPVKKVSVAMVASDSNGDVDGETFQVNGRVERVVVKAGTPAPDANWDFYLYDEDGVDVLGNSGKNLTATEVRSITLPDIPVKGTLEPTGDEMGNTGDEEASATIYYG